MVWIGMSHCRLILSKNGMRGGHHCQALKCLMLNIPRTYGRVPISQAHSTELLVFSDASTMAIAAVAYVKLVYGTEQRLGFILGKTKL